MLDLFGHGAHVGCVLAEHERDVLGAAAQRRLGTVSSNIAAAHDDDAAVQLGQRPRGLDALGDDAGFGQEVLGGQEVLLGRQALTKARVSATLTNGLRERPVG